MTRLIKGDIVLINNEPYQVRVGYKQGQNVPDVEDYNVHLRSVHYHTSRYPNDFYCKLSQLPPFEILK